MREDPHRPEACELVEQAPVGLLVVLLDVGDEEARVTFANAHAARLAGCAPGDLVGSRLADLLGDDWPLLFARMVAEPDERAGAPRFETELTRADRSPHPVSLVWSPLRAPAADRARSVVLAVIDEAHHRRVEETLRHQALHDPLTGLANRILVVELLEQALTEVRRHDCTVAVAYVDVDDLKAVNETLGHEAGDELLLTVAQRLPRSLRATDVVGRIGGDEFVVVFPALTEEHDVRHLGERILDSVAGPILLNDRSHAVSVSVGLATAGREPADPALVLNRADEAMRRAKRQGKNQVAYFDEALDAEIRASQVLDAELRHAIDADELRLAFQPVVNLVDGHLEGMEVLVRWQHPDRGLLPPLDFLPAAEASGAIAPLGRWVLDAACEELSRLADRQPDLSISVNVSAAQLGRDELVPAVTSALRHSGLPSAALRLEVTETAMTESPDSLQELWELDRLGVAVGIDDFGTGYGSLTYLQSLPARFLKIDRSFVHDLPGNEGHLAVVRAVVELALDLGIAVVAEGVETAEQADLLRELGCPSAQGFLFSKPVLADRLDECLAALT